MKRKTYLVTGTFGSGKETWIEKNIKERKKDFEVLTVTEHSVAGINECIHYANIKNRDVYIKSISFSDTPRIIIEIADEIMIFENNESEDKWL